MTQPQHPSEAATSRSPVSNDDMLRSHLQEVVDSTEFAGSERRRHLLTYLVEETLAGRGSDLKAYRIARTVLHRPSGFDPQSDPIVRVEIGRLRSTLDRYYRAHPTTPVIISIPKGHYAAEFANVAQSVPAPDPCGRSRVKIQRFAANSQHAAEVSDAIIDAVAYKVTLLTNDPGSVLVVDNGASQPGDEACRLQGTVRAVGGRVRVGVQAFLPGEPTPFWMETFDDSIRGDHDDALGPVDRIAERITWKLIGDWGPLARRGRRLIDRQAPEPVRSSQLSYYKAFESVEPDLLSSAATQLDPLATSDVEDARSLAALSDTITACWLLSAELAPEVRQRAEDLAVRAVAADPRLVEAHLALAYAHFAARRSKLMDTAFETALGLATPSPNTLHCVAFVRALDGDWERAEPMAARAFELNPELPIYWHVVPCISAIHRGDLDVAYVESLQIGDTIGFAGQALRLATMFAQGLPTNEEAKRFRMLIPDPEEQAVQDTVARVFHDPDTYDLILSAVDATAVAVC